MFDSADTSGNNFGFLGGRPTLRFGAGSVGSDVAGGRESTLAVVLTVFDLPRFRGIFDSSLTVVATGAASGAATNAE